MEISTIKLRYPLYSGDINYTYSGDIDYTYSGDIHCSEDINYIVEISTIVDIKDMVISYEALNSTKYILIYIIHVTIAKYSASGLMSDQSHSLSELLY